jgi:AdoMet-dependent rRNA methyltransferase SPB1
MPQKGKKKERLDKYYYLAKEHGFRSRATFKLVQLNKKYNFFANSSVCIDLCAAPGGWLQAASKLMPISSIKIGVDLDPIKAIPGCTTFVSDITTQDCRNKLEKELKHMKADIVLNDGAPNVGGNWVNDAYNQSELVLFSLKLASEFLKVGGTFVSKVFRSSDYSSLIYVMNQLFKKVEASKPLASRQVSAEIFLVCQGFKGGKIDSKLLDPKYALKQLDDDEDTKMIGIKSIKSLLQAGKNRHRSGYYSDQLYKEKEFSELVDCHNPYQYFYEVNKITCNSEKSKEYLDLTSVKKPKGWEYLFEDLKVLGKTEFSTLLFWRDKIRTKHSRKKNILGEDAVDGEITEKSEAEKQEEYKKKKIAQMEEEIKKDEKSRKKKMEDIEKKKEKHDLRQKLSFLKENQYFDDIGNDFDPTLFKYIKDNDINIEEVDHHVSDSESEEESEKIEEFKEDENHPESDFDEEDYYEMMNLNIENNLDEFKNEQNFNARKKQELKKNKELKKKKKYLKGEDLNQDVSDIDDREIVNEKDSDDESDEEKKNSKKDSDDSDRNDDDFMDELDYDYDHDAMNDKKNTNKNKVEKKTKFQEDKDELDYILSINKDKKKSNDKKSKKNTTEKKEIENIDDLIKTNTINNNKDKFVNPLKKLKEKKEKSKANNLDLKEEKDTENDNTKSKKIKPKKDDEEASNMSSDTDDEIKTKLLSKKRKNQIDKRNALLDKQGIEIVPNEDIEDVENLDVDEIAEIRALAKKMLRKKDRLDIIDQSYNRYAFEDMNVAPDWFNEDERQHIVQIKPTTKAEVDIEREYIREMNTRTPKKVREAVSRKKRKLAKQMDKIKKKANVISNQEEIGENSKLKQINALYKKETIKNKPQKKYTMVRSATAITKRSKNVKFVDKRLKKDKRAQKRIDRSGRNKRGNSEMNKKKIEKTKSKKNATNKNRRR